jgi:hypothetical protein
VHQLPEALHAGGAEDGERQRGIQTLPAPAATRPVSLPLPAFDNAALPLEALLDGGDCCVGLLYTGAAAEKCDFSVLSSERASSGLEALSLLYLSLARNSWMTHLPHSLSALTALRVDHVAL